MKKKKVFLTGNKSGYIYLYVQSLEIFLYLKWSLHLACLSRLTKRREGQRNWVRFYIYPYLYKHHAQKFAKFAIAN